MSGSIRPLFNVVEVRRALTILAESKSVFEVRALEARLSSERRTGIVSGYFDNVPECLKQLSQLTSARGIYVTLNPLDPALLARRANRLDYVGKDGTTSDQHVLTRHWLLIDVDADRPSGISATDAEKESAHVKSREIYRYLRDCGWPDPVVCDSGNGFHMLFRVKLLSADERLIERLLAALANYFDGNGVKIDRSVHNPARIVRLYGTLAAKGDDTKDRPHRLSKIITRRSLVALTKEESIQKVLADLEALVTPKTNEHHGNANRNSKPDKAQIREMLRFIPKRPGHPDWIKIVASVGDALPDEDAIELLKEWSPEEKEGEYADKLQHRLKDVTVGTLIYLAKQHGWKRPEKTYPSRNAEAARELQGDIAAAQIDVQSSDAAHEEKRNDLTSLTSLDTANYPAPIEEAAFHGLAGDFVKRVLPHTEADPAALLIQFLIAFGNVIGRDPHAIADASRHGGNLFAVFTGETSKSRKGTSWKHVLKLFAHVAGQWRRNCSATGLSTGEGLIWAVRDPIEKMENGETVVADPGVQDKRLLVVEEEFSKVLEVADREKNTLSAVLRSAWDGDDVLRIMTKTSPARATHAHISINGHITREELRRKLTETASANGFGNRFLWPAVRRSKVLPEGGGSYDITDVVEWLKEAVAFARGVGELKRDEAARKLWAQVYPELSAGKTGLLGAITARAEAQVLRLSGLYALLDCSKVVRVEHLKAALAVWKYCEDSARWIFETKTGNWRADRILTALKVAGEKGKTKEQIRRDEFNGHITSFELDEALRLLFHSRLADRKEEHTGGRRAERWSARPEVGEKSEQREESHTDTSLTSLNSQPWASENASSTTPDAAPIASRPSELTKPTSSTSVSHHEDPEGETLI